jgi:hypothetical protein
MKYFRHRWGALLDQTPKVAGPVLSGQKIEEPGPKTSWYPEKQMLLLQLKIQFVRWTKTASVRFPFPLMRIRMNKTPSCSRTLRSNKKRPRGTCTSLFFFRMHCKLHRVIRILGPPLHVYYGTCNE